MAADSQWDSRSDARDRSRPFGELQNSFVIRGRGMWGGCMDIQSKLSEYGVCRYLSWDPRPPMWRFLFDTYLNKSQVTAVLQHIMDRWQVKID